jgi:hypothetical protein
MKALLIALLVVSALSSSVESNAPTPPMEFNVISQTNQPRYAYVYEDDEKVYTNVNGVITIIKTAWVTNTVTAISPIPMLIFDVDRSDSLTGSNGWEQVDTFWMPLRTNDPQGFYRVRARFLK